MLTEIGAFVAHQPHCPRRASQQSCPLHLSREVPSATAGPRVSSLKQNFSSGLNTESTLAKFLHLSVAQAHHL